MPIPIRLRSLSLLPALLLALLSIPAPARAQELSVEKYTLPDGMTVILHEDHSVPQVAVDIWYYVGSKDEPQGRSGFAHLFEHLMFMGTDRVPEGQFDTIMEGGGGFNNASTNEDRTNYYSMGPSELLPTLLWLDADRLEDLGAAMTQEKLDKQRDVVRNERRQSYENRPYGRADLEVYRIMFPVGHPYHRTVIGSHEDLEAARVEDVKTFFGTYYVPSNASLVVAGDFDPATVKPLVAKWFGTLPRGSDVIHPAPGPVSLDGIHRLTMTDKVQFARTEMVYHSPKRFAPGDAEMALAAAILADGISSRLYQRLVYNDKIAVDVDSEQESMLLGSLFRVRATVREGVDPAKVESAIDEVISGFVDKGPTAEELEKQKARLEYAAVSQMQSILRKADRLNTYQFYFGEPNSFKRDLDRYRQATADGVRTWARRVLTQDKRLILRVIPEIEPPEPSPRDGQPAIGKAAAFTPPLPETFELSNGVTVNLWSRPDLPLVTMTTVFPAGAASDPPGEAGLASLTASMLDQGAGSMGAIQFADALDLLGASFSARAGREDSTVRLSCLTRNFGKALALYADALLRPAFDAGEWSRVHDLHVQDLVRDLDQPPVVAQNVAFRAYFGDDHPYSRPVDGTPDSARSITLDEARAYRARLFRPEGAVILVAGDIDARQLREALESALGGWKPDRGSKPLTRPAYPAPAAKTFRVVMVDRPGAVQTVVRFMMPAPSYESPDRKKYDLLGTILGGSFTSRLNHNLREEHGYTYGAGCGYVMEPSLGYMTASSRVRTDVTGAALGEFYKEFRGIRNGDVTDEEARKARASERTDLIRSFSGLDGILGSATTLVVNHRPFTGLGDDLAAVSKITAGDLNGIAHAAVPLESGVLVLVGDRKAILPQLEGLKLSEP
ncbi:MAG TPA: pitrilysin family protein, partial [Candidatus Saccharimonadales bacterium]|nr:pitrilysin family protein [Candidatus Saccharimonadales bacterium]